MPPARRRQPSAKALEAASAVSVASPRTKKASTSNATNEADNEEETTRSEAYESDSNELAATTSIKGGGEDSARIGNNSTRSRRNKTTTLGPTSDPAVKPDKTTKPSRTTSRRSSSSSTPTAAAAAAAAAVSSRSKGKQPAITTRTKTKTKAKAGSSLSTGDDQIEQADVETFEEEDMNDHDVVAEGSSARTKDQGGDDEEMQDEAEEDEEEPEEDGDDYDLTEKEPDLTLYCICLGFSGEKPMIQCDHCSNWYHFNCIGIDDDTAASIEAYCCDICTGMGKGVTRYAPDSRAPGHAADSDEEASEEENDDIFRNDIDIDMNLPESEANIEDDGEYSEGTTNKRTKVKEAVTGREKKKPKVESSVEKEPTKKRVPRRRQQEHDEDFVVADDEEVIEESSRALASDKPSTSSARVVSSSNNKAKGKDSTSNGQDTTPTPADSANIPDAPATDKVRAHVIKQLQTIFLSIFTATDELPPEFHSEEDRAISFATDVEQELFHGFAEIDLKASVRGPRAKYSSKFRSLHYNLKTNANFRERIAANELTAAQIVGMTNEALLRPELKKMAETVRAFSLKQSVKEVIGIPTAKRTHKGEEEIGEDARKGLIEAEEKAFADHERRGRTERERSDSINASESASKGLGPLRAISPFAAEPSETGATQNRAMSPGHQTMSPPAQSPTIGAMSPPLSTSRTHRNSLSSSSTKGVDVPGEASRPSSILPQPTRRVSNSNSGSPPPFSATRRVSGSGSPMMDEVPFPMATAPKPRSRSSFDMASIWGKVKKADSEEKEETKTMDENDKSERSTTPTAPEPIDNESIKKTQVVEVESEDDEFEAELFGTAEKGKARKASITASRPKTIAELNEISTPVWNNDVFVPEEGGFPGYAIQAAGRPLGVDRSAWSRILPVRSWTLANRLPTAQAHQYLMECWSSPSRELIILALMPDLQGPTPDSPHRPIQEKCLAKHQHIIDFYTRKDRVGVVTPPKELRALLRDLYIVPLKKEQSLPDFVQVLDDKSIPKVREVDLLLAVLVTQRNALPTITPTPRSRTTSMDPNPAVTISAATPESVTPIAPLSSSIASPLARSDGRSPLSGNMSPIQTNPNPSFAPQPLPTSQQTSHATMAPSSVPGTTPPLPFDAASLASLSSLLSDPSLLQSLANVQAILPGSASPIPPAPPAGFVPPPGLSPIHNSNVGGSSTPEWNRSTGNRGDEGGYSPLPSTSSSSGSMNPPVPTPIGIHPSRLALFNEPTRGGGGGGEGRGGSASPGRDPSHGYDPSRPSRRGERSSSSSSAQQGWGSRAGGSGYNRSNAR